jgi:hypothetical protein
MIIASKLQSLIFGLFFILEIVLSEFRFCYKGPHKFTELDCPGGFVAKSKLSISCKYYARTQNISTTS